MHKSFIRKNINNDINKSEIESIIFTVFFIFVFRYDDPAKNAVNNLFKRIRIIVQLLFNSSRIIDTGDFLIFGYTNYRIVH